MKKNFLLSMLFVMACAVTSYAQVSIGNLGFSYSALVRDSVGSVQPLKPVSLRFTILTDQNGSAANSPWIETQATTTDGYGFVNVTIGNGNRTGGMVTEFADVDFSLGNYWIMIEVLNTSTSTWDPLAKQGLQAVPYAKVAGALAGAQAVPAGTIVAFAGPAANIPDGWRLCDGLEVSVTDAAYVNLFNAIGTAWGSSTPVLFNLPDLRGVFLRGTSVGTTNDPDINYRTSLKIGGNGGNNVGSYQDCSVQIHYHGTALAYNQSPYGLLPGGNPALLQIGGGQATAVPTSTTGCVNCGGTANETRPKNVYVNYIIKL